MKGLFIKDIKLLLLQKNYLIINLIMATAISVLTNNESFGIGFLSFIAILLTVNTVSYDEFDNGFAFIFTLPITRKEYVKEKYLLGLLFGCASWLIATIISIMISNIKNTLSLNEIIEAATITLFIMVLILAIILPFQLKYGSEKGRIAMICSLGGLFLIIILITKIIEMFYNTDISNIINNLTITDSTKCIIYLISLSLLSLGISIKSSTAIMTNKEF